jgi:DNA-binding MarR family transcriptional regulator
VADKSLAKALKRKMGLDEDILARGRVISGEVSLLMNAQRRRIFEYVCNHPCSHLREISRKLDMSLQTAKWHLEKLHGGGLLAMVAKGKKTLFYPNNRILGIQECELISLLYRKDALKVFLFIRQHPKQTQKAMIQSLDIYQQRLSGILLSLEKPGLISFEKVGREKAYCTTPKIRELEESLQTMTPRYERWLMEVLTMDGVNPKVTGSDSKIVTIRLDFGAEEDPVLKINKNPLAALLRTGKY